MSHAETRILTFGIAGSLVIHLAAAFTLATWIAFAPAPKMVPKPAEEEPKEEIILPTDLVAETPPPPAPAPAAVEPESLKPQTPPPPPPRRFVENEDNEASAKTPERAGFISDRSTVATAKTAPDPKADQDLPNMKGVKVKTLDMANREYKDGEDKHDRPEPSPPPAPPMPPAPPKVAQQQQPPPPPPPTPKAEPLPPPEKMAKKDDSSAEKMMKELDAALLREKEKEKEKEIKEPPPEVKKPDQPPAPKTPDLKLPDESLLPPSMPVAPPTPPALKTAKNEFVPQKRTSEIKGKISNVGNQDSVDAVETAEGRYVQAVKAAIRKRWQFHVMQKGDFLQPCDIVLQFSITKEGKAKEVKILSSNGNAVITDITLSSLLEAKIPPIPDDLRKQMGSDVFEMPMEFVVY